MRLFAILLASATLLTAAEGDVGPKPMPRPNLQPQTIPIQMGGGAKLQSTFRIIAIDGKGPTAAGQQVLDQLLADGWAVRGLSTLEGKPEGESKIVVWATKPQPAAKP